MKAGFIGLGRMGQAMASRLLDGGHALGVYNRTAEKLRPLTGLGAKPLDSIKAAASCNLKIGMPASTSFCRFSAMFSYSTA